MEFQSPLGIVVKAATDQITVECLDKAAAESVEVGWLCAVQHSESGSWIVAMIDQLRRPHEDENSSADPHAIIEMTLIGQYAKDPGGNFYFKRGTDAYPRLGAECFHLDSDNLRTLLMSLNAAFDESERFEIGTFTLSKSVRAAVSGNRFFQRHAAVLGSTGSGKSWTVATLLEQARQLQSANIVLFDLHGEYEPLSDPETGFCQRLKIAGPSTEANSDDDVLFLPYWLLSRDEFFTVIADIRQDTAYNQASRFTKHMLDLKQEWRDREGLGEELSSLTVDSPVPFSLTELIRRLDEDNSEMVPGARAGAEKKGPWNGQLTKALERLRDKAADQRNQFLFQPPAESMSSDWLGEFAGRLLCAGDGLRGIKIIDFSEVPADLLPVAISVLARFLYQTQFWTDPKDRLPFCLICDEAHLYLPRHDQADVQQARALDAFERIAKEGRKYGVSLLVVSQRPSDISTTILSQCNNMLALRLTNPQDQSVVRRLLPDGMRSIPQILPILETGEAMLIGDAVALPLRIRLDVPQIQPSSATREFWVDWRTGSSSAAVISQAVASLRRQSRRRKTETPSADETVGED